MTQTRLPRSTHKLKKMAIDLLKKNRNYLLKAEGKPVLGSTTLDLEDSVEVEIKDTEEINEAKIPAKVRAISSREVGSRLIKFSFLKDLILEPYFTKLHIC